MSVYAASLDVECTHCHDGATWGPAATRGYRMVDVMGQVVDAIPTYFEPDGRRPRIQCFMCHQGRIDVERVPRPSPPR